MKPPTMPPPEIPDRVFPCGHTTGTIDVASIRYSKARAVLWAVDCVLVRATYFVVCDQCGKRHRESACWHIDKDYYKQLCNTGAYGDTCFVMERA